MKRLLSFLLSVLLLCGIAAQAYAFDGDGNFDGGGGSLGDGTSSNYWNPGMDGVRVSVVNIDTHSVVGNIIDLTNKTPSTGMFHFGKISKLSYNAGQTLTPRAGNYHFINPAQSLPRIISTGSYPASIEAIRSYFTDEQVIRSIAGYVGMDFDTLVGGDYKIVVEPIAYLVYQGAYYAMTATEAALYDQQVNGDLRYKMGSLTHKNLPLAIFLEEADLGYPAWSGSTNSKVSNAQILSSLGIGIVRFNEETEPPEAGAYDYEYRVDTDVITSVEVSGGQSDPDDPVSVRFNIQGTTYTVSKGIAELNAKLLMLEQLRSKGYLAIEVYQAQANEINAELSKLKDARQEQFDSKVAAMLDEVKKLKMFLFELEEPLERFDEKLFMETVKAIQINKEDEMSVEFLGGLRFKERI